MRKDWVYLVQTDTTVGFSSDDANKLSLIKERPTSQKMLQTVDAFSTLNRNTRVPKKFRRHVRNATKTTFIYPNEDSFRVIHQESNFYTFIHKFKQLYSTSANRTKESFESSFAMHNADVIVYTQEVFTQNASSAIFKLGKEKIKKIR